MGLRKGKKVSFALFIGLHKKITEKKEIRHIAEQFVQGECNVLCITYKNVYKKKKKKYIYYGIGIQIGYGVVVQP